VEGEWVTLDDVQLALDKLRLRRAPGEDGMPPAVLKGLKHVEGACEALTDVLNACVTDGVWIPEWSRLLVAPVIKAGKDPASVDSYRPIHLECVLAKLMAIIVDRRLRALDTGAGLESQFGFREGRGCRDALFAIRRALRRARGRAVYACFVDFKAAFPRVDRTVLWAVLEARGLPPVWLRYVQCMYADVEAVIQGSTETFAEELGVKQGDPLSPWLFILLIAGVPARLQEAAARVDRHRAWGGGLHARCTIPAALRSLFYADDLALLSTSRDVLQAMLDELERCCVDLGLTVAVSKTQWVRISNRAVAPS
jgi:hypothetical protein